jgi:hemerythrin
LSLLDWSKSLDIGVDAMNSEHKVLLAIMNKLYDRNEAKADRAELKALLKELGDYTVKHFTDEEAYLLSIQFPELEKHKLIHKSLLEKFAAHMTEFNKSGVLEESFFGFLKMWLSAHIQGIDMKYGDYAKTHK